MTEPLTGRLRTRYVSRWFGPDRCILEVEYVPAGVRAWDRDLGWRAPDVQEIKTATDENSLKVRNEKGF